MRPLCPRNDEALTFPNLLGLLPSKSDRMSDRDRSEPHPPVINAVA